MGSRTLRALPRFHRHWRRRFQRFPWPLGLLRLSCQIRRNARPLVPTELKPRTIARKEKKGGARCAPPSRFPGRVLLSHDAIAHSTIGAEGLNCRVRDGNGCFTFAMATGNLALTLHVWSGRVLIIDN